MLFWKGEGGEGFFLHFSDSKGRNEWNCAVYVCMYKYLLSV